MEGEITADESVSTAVTRAVSAVQGCHPQALPSLEAVLDPDALDALFDSTDEGASRTGGHLAFVYSNCRVTIENGEFLTVEPIENCFSGAPAPRITDRQGQ